MTKAAALALVNALEAQAIPCTVSLTFPAAGGEQWAVALDPAEVYTGGQLTQLTAYCAAHGLAVTAQFTALGIV